LERHDVLVCEAPQFEFVWITDGQGWLTAKNKLEEAYNIIPSMYNLSTLDNFVTKVLKEEVIPFK
jgi:type II restriction enzyme